MIRWTSLIVISAVLAAGCGSDAGNPDAAVSSADPAPDSLSASASGSDDSSDEREEAAAAPTEAGDTEGDTGGDIEGDSEPTPSRPWAPTDLDGGVETGNAARWTVEILDTRPHDTSAFTQGLEIHDGTLYESTGLTGESTVRIVDIGSGDVLSSLDVDAQVFAEGLTVAGDRIIQITHQAELAYVRDLDSLEIVGQFGYEGQGWGICYDGSRLVMSNGTADLGFRDPTTFDIVETVEVRLNGEPVRSLNELECVDGYVFANVWKTNMIVVIEPSRGGVVAVIDASELALDATGVMDEQSRVLNGVARLDETTFLLTGKKWPSMYRVRLVAA